MFGYYYKDAQGRTDGRSPLMYYSPEDAIRRGEDDMPWYKKERGYTVHVWTQKKEGN